MTRLDICDNTAVRNLFRAHSAQTVILAAGLNRSAAHRDPSRSWQINVDATRSVATAALECGVRHLVFTSSYAVYGNSSGKPITEAAPTRPTSVYGRMKAAAEETLEQFRPLGLTVTIMRLCGIYGPSRRDIGGSYATQFFAAAIAEVARTGRLVIRAPNAAVDEFLYVKDVAKAIVMTVLATSPTLNGAFNVGAGSTVTGIQVRDSLRRLFPAARIDVSSSPLSDERGKAALDISRIRRELGFEPRYELTEGLADYLNELTRR